MTINRFLGACAFACLAVPALGGCAAQAAVQGVEPAAATIEQVIARNTEARGGAAALDRVRSVLIEVEIIEGALTLNGRYAANDKGMVRIDVYAAGKLVASEGVDTSGVWILGKDGPQPSVATGAANALTNGAQTHLFGWHRFADLGHKLSLATPETIDGVTYPVVKVVLATGAPSYNYVDPATWLVVRRRDERAYHPDVDLTKKRVETRFSDFVSVEGVVAPHRNVDLNLADESVLSTNRVLSRQINPQLPADHFDRNRRAPATW